MRDLPRMDAAHRATEKESIISHRWTPMNTDKTKGFWQRDALVREKNPAKEMFDLSLHNLATITVELATANHPPLFAPSLSCLIDLRPSASICG